MKSTTAAIFGLTLVFGLADTTAKVNVDPGPQQDEEQSAGGKCDRLREKAQKLQSDIDEANATIENLNESIAEINEDIEEAQEEMQHDLDQVTHYQNEYNERCTGPSPNYISCLNLQGLITHFQTQADGHESDIGVFQQQVANHELTISLLQMDIEDWEEELADVNAQLADCPEE